MPLSTWWLIAAVLLAPLWAFPTTTGIGLLQAKNIGFIIVGLAVVLWRTPNLWLQAFAAWTVLAFMASGMRLWAMTGVLAVLAWILLYSEAARLTEAHWRKIRLAVAVAALFQIFWMGVQALGFDAIFVTAPYYPLSAAAGGPPPVIGWFGNTMDAALFLGVSLPALIALSPWLLPVGAIALLVLGATVGLVSLVIAALWWAPTWRWRVVIASVLCAVSVWFLTVRDPVGIGLRPLIWRQTAFLAIQRPVFGWGPNALGHRIQLINPATNERWDFAFNEWVQGAMELGIVGPLLAAGWLGHMGWRLRGRWDAAREALPVVAVLVAASTFSIPFRIGPVALLSALYLGRLEAMTAEAPL